MGRFDDRLVRLDAPEQLADLANVLSAPTRLEVLRRLVRSPTPLHINELARRVGVDASPVRTHLELLCRAGLAREVPTPGRERRFEAIVDDVRLTLEGSGRVRHTPPGEAPLKPVVKLQKRLEALEKQMAALEAKAKRVKQEMQKAWDAHDARRG